MRYKFICLAVFMLVLPGLAGCASEGSTSAPSTHSASPTEQSAGADLTAWSPKATGTIDSFSWAVSGEPSTFDWTKDNSSHLNRVLPNVVERLFFKDPDGGRKPALATSYRTPIPTTVRLGIRDHVHFHDGSLMTARDVVASLNRSRAKGSVWAYALKSIDSVKATDPHHVKIKLSEPDSLLRKYLSTAAGSVESAAFLKRAGDDYGSGPKYLDGTGAFTMTRWDRGSRIDLKRADHYWGDPALAGKVRLKIIEDSGTRDQALASGEIDGSSAVGSGAGPEIMSKDPGGHMYYGAGTSTWAVAFFNYHGVLDDPRVRRALSLAIDRDGVVAAASNGTATPAGDFAAPGLWPKKSDRRPALTQNIAKAKKLIESAHARGKKVVLKYSAQSSTVTPMATAVAAAGKAIGLNIDMHKVSTAVTNAFQSDPESRKGTDISLAMLGGQSGDPLEVYREFEPDGMLNFAGYTNPTLNKLLDDAAQGAGHKRTKRLRKARNILLSDMPWIPLISSPVAVYFGKSITGGPTNSAGTQNFPWAKYVGRR